MLVEGKVRVVYVVDWQCSGDVDKGRGGGRLVRIADRQAERRAATGASFGASTTTCNDIPHLQLQRPCKLQNVML